LRRKHEVNVPFSRVYGFFELTETAPGISIVDWRYQRSKFFTISREKAGSSSRIGTYLQFSDADAAARTECWEDSACERGEKQVEVVEEEEEEIEKNLSALPAR